jgi:hypothetical protein
MPRLCRRPKPDRRRGLELRASCRDGCMESIMLAHGFSIDMMVELVRAGLQRRGPSAWLPADARWRSSACGLPRKDGKRWRNDADSNGKLALPASRSRCYRSRSSAALEGGGPLSMWRRQAVWQLLRAPQPVTIQADRRIPAARCDNGILAPQMVHGFDAQLLANDLKGALHFKNCAVYSER